MRNHSTRTVTLGFYLLACALAASALTAAPARAWQHWYSGSVAKSDANAGSSGSLSFAIVPGSECLSDPNVRCFDLVVSLYDDPQGDDDGNTQGVDSGSAEQDNIERIVQHFADAVFEATEGQHKLRTVRIFRGESKGDTADVVWSASGPPGVQLSGMLSALNGIGDAGKHIFMVDDFAGFDMRSDERGAGYALAHEWGHYAYGLRSEYAEQGVPCGPAPNETTPPCRDDTEVMPSLMGRQWFARAAAGGALIDSRWLNFSVAQTPAGGLFENTGNTAHDRLYGRSGWEVLASGRTREEIILFGGLGLLARPIYPELAAVAPVAGQVPAFDPSRIIIDSAAAQSELDILWMTSTLTYLLVIDRSGSMAGAPIVNARTAARGLVDLAIVGSTKIGVISFGGNVRTDIGLTPIDEEADKDTVKGVINFGAGSGTPMTGALQRALAVLMAQRCSVSRTSCTIDANCPAGEACVPDAPADETRVVFLLSDGEPTDGNPRSLIPAFQEKQIPICTFAYGGNAGVALLTDLAQQTGCQVFRSPVALDEIQPAFNAALALVSQITSVKTDDVDLTMTPESFPFEIDPTIGAFNVTVLHDGVPTAAVVELFDPLGNPVAASDVVQSGGTTRRFFEVDVPVVGEWVIEASAAAAPVGFSFEVFAEPLGSTFALSADSLFGPALLYPQPFIITANLAKDLPIAGAMASATVTLPDDVTTVDVDVRDDGVAPDAVAGDGTYTGIVSYAQDGTYDVLVVARGEAGTARQTATGLERSSGPDGTPLPPLQDHPVTATFERFVRFQVTVSGVTVDDHQDTPPAATPVVNVEAPEAGIINGPGDRDVFSFVVPADATCLEARVSGLTFGMDPTLVVLGSDGVTALRTATLANDDGDGNALVVRLAPTPGETLFAEVSHADAGQSTGGYAFSFGSCPAEPCRDVIDFDSGGLASGDIVDEVSGQLGVGPVFVHGNNSRLGTRNAAVVFDSSCPGGCSGEDIDLGTPNEDFGGPGVGEGGAAAGAAPNGAALRNALIIAEDLVDRDGDGRVDDPDDQGGRNVSVDFDFSAVAPAVIREFTIVDVERTESAPTVDVYDASGSRLERYSIPWTEDNGARVVELDGAEGLDSMRVTLRGSAALDNIVFEKSCDDMDVCTTDTCEQTGVCRHEFDAANDPSCVTTTTTRTTSTSTTTTSTTTTSTTTTTVPVSTSTSSTSTTTTTGTTSTTSDTTSPTVLMSSCAALAAVDCVEAGRGQLQMSPRAGASGGKLKWIWSHDSNSAPADIGDPTRATAYALCVWDGVQGEAVKVLEREFPAGADWRVGRIRRALRYAVRTRVPGGSTKIRIAAGRRGGDRIRISARGAHAAATFVGAPGRTASVNPNLVVRLVNSEGCCWSTEFDEVQRNTETQLGARTP